MCDFDLSQALEGPLESDERGFESRCFNITSSSTTKASPQASVGRRNDDSNSTLGHHCHVQDVQDELFRLDEGLDLVVSHNPKTMQCVATLLLAVNRMKRSLTHCGRELSEGELCSLIMDSLVDETVVKTTVNFSTGQKTSIFHRLNSGEVCTLCDGENKDVIQALEELKLQAVTLKGGNCERKVNFKLAKYISSSVPPGNGETVRLSITGSNFHISCFMKDGRAVLNLEECSKEKLQTISDDGNMNRFLFCKRVTGRSIITFESVKCPGWFISTSHEAENQPVEMCEADTARRVTTFKIN